MMDRRAYDAWIDALTCACRAADSLQPHKYKHVREVIAQGMQFAAPIAYEVRQDNKPPNWMGW